MAGYQRKTVFPPQLVLAKAEEFLPEYIGLQESDATRHRATYTGKEGTVILEVHRHGPYTDVTALTDQLRTSRMDYEIQRFLTCLPYEPGDSGGPGSGDPDPVAGPGRGR